MPEIVYVLTNEAMPDLVKIGCTTASVEDRIRSLDTTGIPLPFQCFYAGQVPNARLVEQRIHRIFSDKRIRQNREFFRVDPNQVREAILLAEIADVTPRIDVVVDPSDIEALKAASSAEQRRARLKFSNLHIPIGAILTFVKDRTQTCTVVGDGQVKFDDQVISPSAAALIVVQRMGYNWGAVSGSSYWEYENETLDARRMRLEAEAEIV